MFGYWIILFYLFGGGNRNMCCGRTSWQNQGRCGCESFCEQRREREADCGCMRERESECGCDNQRSNSCCATVFTNPISSRNTECGCGEEFTQTRGFFTGSTTCGCEVKD